MSVSIKDVAREAGKSPGTVSQVLNNRRLNVRISDDTRQLILEAADRLGYRPNPIARSLRTQRTNTIGVLVNALGPNPRQFDAVERVDRKAGYQLLMSISRDDVEHEEHAIKHLIRRQIDGLLLISPAIREGHRRALEELIDKRFPLIGIGPLPVAGGSFVDWDRADAYLAVAQHLIAGGCRRIGFVAAGLSPGVRGRIDGLRAGCALEPGVSLELFGCDASSALIGVEALAARMRQPLKARQLDAVVTQSDALAVAVMQVARTVGVKVPRELAVVGCSNSEFGAMLDVPLTTISLPDVQLAERAMDLLVSRISRPAAASPHVAERLPAELLVRSSSLLGSAISRPRA